MRWASAISGDTDLPSALGEIFAQVEARLAGAPVDFAALFVSPHHAPVLPEMVELMGERFPTAARVGCTGQGIIGTGHEIEELPAISLIAASLPGAEARVFHLTAEDVGAGPRALRERLGVDAGEARGVLILAEPFSTPVEAAIELLHQAWPEAPTVGGLVSGFHRPGEHGLITGSDLRHEGVAGVVFTGNLQLETLVAQGCRPVGQPCFVTRAHKNVIQALDGQPPLAIIRALVDGLSPAERDRLRRSLHVGVVMDPGLETYGPGDFLIRNLVGADTDSGSIAVGANLEERMVVQFHVRDAAASAEDLDRQLQAYAGDHQSGPAGALLFSCLGRGLHLYGEPDHDTGLFEHHLGEVPLGGFFCNGEIGPVAGRPWLHGYTSAMALFRELGDH